MMGLLQAVLLPHLNMVEHKRPSPTECIYMIYGHLSCLWLAFAWLWKGKVMAESSWRNLPNKGTGR